jgi:TusE/DsrC/DsvC family sulfur relay protein
VGVVAGQGGPAGQQGLAQLPGLRRTQAGEHLCLERGDPAAISTQEPSPVGDGREASRSPGRRRVRARVRVGWEGLRAMPVTTMNGRVIQVNDEGFLTEYDEWDEDLARTLAGNIGIDLTDQHWKVIRFLRDDFKTQGESPTTRRVQTAGGIPVKEQFELVLSRPD